MLMVLIIVFCICNTVFYQNIAFHAINISSDWCEGIHLMTRSLSALFV